MVSGTALGYMAETLMLGKRTLWGTLDPPPPGRRLGPPPSGASGHHNPAGA